MHEQQVFASTYVTGGATSTINGSVAAGTYITTGVSATIYGNAAAGTATTLGANSMVAGSIESGTVTTVGEGATIDSAKTESGSPSAMTPDFDRGQQEILQAQQFLRLFESGEVLKSGDIDDTTFTAKTYGVAGHLTATENTIITLDANHQDSEFIFNISSNLTFGEGVTVKVINDRDGAGNEVHVSVVWNATGGYITLGARANVVGTLLARGYVSTGASSTLSGPGNTCGGAVYSASSYISIGAGATLGAGAGCTAPPPYTAPAASLGVSS
ncbi:MAG: hypothetical protein ACI8RE_003404 [Ilumatobacter sp.]|jgi:hypothetical protein